MWQITALVPAAKTLFEIFCLWWRRPATLPLDQITHARIVRRTGTTRFGWLTHANIEPETVKRDKSAIGARLCPAQRDQSQQLRQRGQVKKSGSSGSSNVAAAGPLDTAALQPSASRISIQRKAHSLTNGLRQKEVMTLLVAVCKSPIFLTQNQHAKISSA